MNQAGNPWLESYTFGEPPDLFKLESGRTLGPVTLAYETYGQLNSEGSNAVLVLHALTGDTHLASHQDEGDSPDKLPGWWEPLVGPGRPLDTRYYFVICSNVVGGCYGSTGPASINPDSGKPYGLRFPVATIRDMVLAQRKLLEHLGVRSLALVIGGSMGGMQALEWAITYPELVRAAAPISTSGRLSAQGIAYNEVQRLAIIQDPGWRDGDYYGFNPPSAGLALARMIGTITYKSDDSWNQKFGRVFAGGSPADLFTWEGRFEIENYLHYQGRKLVGRFDANSYLFLTKAMDLHNVGRGYASYQAAFGRVRCPTLVIGISSDFLYPTYQQREIVHLVRQGGGRADYVEIESPFGHDGFLIEFEKIELILRPFLQRYCPV